MDEWLQMIKDCEARESRLSDWERNFIDDISKWLGDGKSLTDGQSQKLESIWDRVTQRG